MEQLKDDERWFYANRYERSKSDLNKGIRKISSLAVKYRLNGDYFTSFLMYYMLIEDRLGVLSYMLLRLRKSDVDAKLSFKDTLDFVNSQTDFLFVKGVKRYYYINKLTNLRLKRNNIIHNPIANYDRVKASDLDALDMLLSKFNREIYKVKKKYYR